MQTFLGSQTELGKAFPFLDKNKPGFDPRVNCVGSDDLYPGVIQVREVALTNAEIKALRASPKTLVAAPGAGYALEFISAVLLLDYGSNALTESADNLAVKLTDGSGTAVSETIEMTGFIDQTADTAIPVARATSAAIAKSAYENKALVLHNTGDGEFGGNAAADTLLRVKVSYSVVATGW